MLKILVMKELDLGYSCANLKKIKLGKNFKDRKNRFWVWGDPTPKP